MKLSLIVAVGPRGEIGWQGGLPWPKLARDMEWFRGRTRGKAVIMGRKTWNSLPVRPLFDRYNIVISSEPAPGAQEPSARCVVPDLDAALAAAAPFDEAVVIGGGRVYRDALPRVEHVYLTKVDPLPEAKPLQADVFFPYPLSPAEWEEKPAFPRFFVDDDAKIRLGFYRFHRIRPT